MTLPVGYERRLVDTREVVAQSAVVSDISMLLHAHPTLYEWAAAAPQVRALRGRAPVYVATLPTTQLSVVVRHAWHGGLFAPVSGDRFLMPTRAPRELAASVRLLAMGVGTAEVLGYALYPAGSGLRRVDVVSRLIPDAYDLGVVVSALAPDLDVQEALCAVRAQLVQLALAGVVHPDLNVKNILLTRTSLSDIRPYVIDVDVVRFETLFDPASVMQANVARLTRSLQKWRTRFGAAITDATIREFSASCVAAVAAAVVEAAAAAAAAAATAAAAQTATDRVRA